MSAMSWFITGLIAGAAAMLGAILFWRVSRGATRPSRRALLAGGLVAGAAAATAAAMSLAINSRQAAAVSPGEPAKADSPAPAMPPSSAMPSASAMSQILAMSRGARTQPAEPMEQAAAGLAARLERQGGTAADWNLLAQAYDFLGRPEDAQGARAKAAQIAAIRRAR